MTRRAFWPGFRWRILAHKRPLKSNPWTSDTFDARSGMDSLAAVGRTVLLDGDWEFDELAIDDWFHLEMMDVREWWLGVGNGDDYWHVNVYIDRDGKATVLVEKQQ